jgi:hypothetical protein
MKTITEIIVERNPQPAGSHTLRVSIPKAGFQPLPLGRKKRFAYAVGRRSLL